MFKRRQQSVAVDDIQKVVANRPPIPDSVKKRFPEMQRYEEEDKQWVQKLTIAIRGGPA
jgi:hypothetical protein